MSRKQVLCVECHFDPSPPSALGPQRRQGSSPTSPLQRRVCDIYRQIAEAGRYASPHFGTLYRSILLTASPPWWDFFDVPGPEAIVRTALQPCPLPPYILQAKRNPNPRQDIQNAQHYGSAPFQGFQFVLAKVHRQCGGRQLGPNFLSGQRAYFFARVVLWVFLAVVKCWLSITLFAPVPYLQFVYPVCLPIVIFVRQVCVADCA